MAISALAPARRCNISIGVPTSLASNTVKTTSAWGPTIGGPIIATDALLSSDPRTMTPGVVTPPGTSSAPSGTDRVMKRGASITTTTTTTAGLTTITTSTKRVPGGYRPTGVMVVAKGLGCTRTIVRIAEVLASRRVATCLVKARAPTKTAVMATGSPSVMATGDGVAVRPT